MNAQTAVIEARPEPQSQTTAVAVTPMQMLAHAMERGADLDQLQKLMDLQERYEANQARKAFVQAMADFKASPPEILKRKHVEYTTTKGTTKYDHATLADVCAAAIQGLARVGISHRWDVKQDGGRIQVTCILTHQQGHSESVSMSSGVDDSGGKNAIQAIGSATTYLSRYTLLAATGLAAADMDDDGRKSEQAECITDKQAADLQALAEEVGANREAFMNYFGIQRLAEMPVSKYAAALAMLQKKRKQA